MTIHEARQSGPLNRARGTATDASGERMRCTIAERIGSGGSNEQRAISVSMRRLIVIASIVIVLALFALGLISPSDLKQMIARSSVASLAQRASEVADAACGQVARMVKLDYWRKFTNDRIRDLKESAALTPSARGVKVVVIRPKTQMAALQPPSAPLEPPANVTTIPVNPPAPAPAPPRELPQMAAGFQGCWQTTIAKPDTWRFLEGPEIDGWSPATYRLCFHRTGGTATASFSADNPLHLTSQWVVPSVGERQGHTDIVFQNGNFVMLHASGVLPMELKILGVFPGPKPVVSYDYYFHCYLQGKKLMVEASMVELCNHSTVEDCHGHPWVRQSWHHELVRVDP